ncbi:MAG TPA: 50S ribosomal protein L18 [bacterium]|nr:50S ribosomal protein L18 [bacterium]
MASTMSRLERRKRRQYRIRKVIKGNAERPRLSVFRSAKHIYVQAVDDLAGQTVAAASTCEKELRESIQGSTGNKVAATVVGKAIAERLKQRGVSAVVFDRGGNRYMGRVQALADGAREAGLKF